MPNLAKLRLIFEEIRLLVERPGNNFDWSSWDDEEEALLEIDRVLGELREGRIPSAGMSILFLPTGPLQELSISSGWGDEFLDLADRFDVAVAEKDGKPCPCLTSATSKRIIIQDLGMDKHYAEVTIEKCQACGSLWLHYVHEHEAFSKSGRWYTGRIYESEIPNLTADAAKETLERMEWYFYGGSFYMGTTGRSSGRINL